MKIGLAGPISVNSLKDYLDNVDEKYLPLGMSGTVVNTLIIGLLENKQDVSVYTIDPRVDKPLILKGKHLTIYIGKNRTNRKLQMLDFFSFEAKQIKNFILEDKPDIINAHWTYEFAVGALRSKYPHLISVHDSAFEMLKIHRDPFRISRYVLDYFVRWRGKYFNTVSDYLKSKLNIPRREIAVIPNPIEEKYVCASPKKIENDVVKIVSIQNGFTPRKNIETALFSFKDLRIKYGTKIEYYLYGHGFEPDGKAYQWALQNNCSEGVIFKGKLLHTQVMADLQNYHILLHPAIEESFGVIFLEGMAKGMPVIGGKDAGAVPWVLNYGENGILVDVMDKNDISRAIELLINDSEKYYELSVKGLKYVKENFSAHSISNKYLDLYKKILANKSH
jgi:glycosyltransferase involved in cell wall biosynthesis